MTKMTTIPENHNNIRAGIVGLLKAARRPSCLTVDIPMRAAPSAEHLTDPEQSRVNTGDPPHCIPATLSMKSTAENWDG
jgi:hypothetical protein